MHDRRDLLRLGEAGAGLRVDVDAQLVRLLRVARGATATRRTRASRGSRPTTTCATSVTQSSSAWRPDGNVTRAVSIQSGRLSGTRFCQITSPPTPFRLPLQLAGPLVERAHDAVADAMKYCDEVELRLAARRKVDLVRVRDLDDAAADLELDERRRPFPGVS